MPVSRMREGRPPTGGPPRRRGGYLENSGAPITDLRAGWLRCPRQDIAPIKGVATWSCDRGILANAIEDNQPKINENPTREVSLPLTHLSPRRTEPVERAFGGAESRPGRGFCPTFGKISAGGDRDRSVWRVLRRRVIVVDRNAAPEV